MHKEFSKKWESSLSLNLNVHVKSNLYLFLIHIYFNHTQNEIIRNYFVFYWLGATFRYRYTVQGLLKVIHVRNISIQIESSNICLELIKWIIFTNCFSLTMILRQYDIVKDVKFKEEKNDRRLLILHISNIHHWIVFTIIIHQIRKHIPNLNLQNLLEAL